MSKTKKAAHRADRYKKEVIQKREQLNAQLKDGTINQETYDKEIEKLEKHRKELGNILTRIVKNFGDNWKEIAINSAQLGAAIVGIFSQMYSQIADLQYQNEMYRIEQLQEDYDYLYFTHLIQVLVFETKIFDAEIKISSNEIKNWCYDSSFDIDLYLAYEDHYDMLQKRYNLFVGKKDEISKEDVLVNNDIDYEVLLLHYPIRTIL